VTKLIPSLTSSFLYPFPFFCTQSPNGCEFVLWVPS